MHEIKEALVHTYDYSGFPSSIIPALSSLRFETKTLKRMHFSYPEYPKTIGDHIRKKRMDLKLLQKDVAKIFSVSEDCIIFWENNRSEPQIKYYPYIIKFLGYYPFALDLSTFKGRIEAFRYLNGLSQKQLAILMKIDPRTALQWEKGQGNGLKRDQMEQFLANYNFNINEYYVIKVDDIMLFRFISF